MSDVTAIIEPSIGAAFIGLGYFLLLCAVTYWLWSVAKMKSRSCDLENEYSDTELSALRELVNRKKPLVGKVRELLVAERRNKKFRQHLEQELIRDYFAEKKK